MSVTTDTITLKGMRFHTLIGIFPHEKELPQPLEIDLSVDLDRSGEAEESNSILDYSELYDQVANIISAGQIDYIEEVAERIAAAALTHAVVSTARVNVRKPHVALKGPLNYAEVSITRTRSGNK